MSGTGTCTSLHNVFYNATNGMELNFSSGGLLYNLMSAFVNCTTAVKSIGEDRIFFTSTEFNICDTDLSVTNLDTTVLTMSTRIARDKMVFPDQYTGFQGAFTDTKTDDEAFNIYSELTVGRPELGRESVLGEGDSYTRGMLAYTYNAGTTAYVNVTDDVTEPNDSSDITLPGTAADNAIYLTTTLKDESGNKIRFPGYKVKNDVALVKGAGNLITEYWNGASWAEFQHMGVRSKGSYLTGAKNFWDEICDCHVRFDDSVGTGWVANDPMSLGADFYWIRVRVENAITTSMTIDRLKIHTNRTEINADGYLEYFGKARPINALPFIYGSFQAASNSPSNQDVFLSDNLDVGMGENSFDNGVTDRTAMTFFLPLDIDTSCPIRFRISYFGLSAGTASVDWNVRWAVSSPGDNIYPTAALAPTAAPGEQVVARSTAMPASANVIQSEIFELEISTAIAERASAASGDLLWISIERVGGTDAYAGDLAMVSIIPYYTKWRDGGHIDNWS